MTLDTTTISGRPNATLPLQGTERLVMDQGIQTVDASAQDVANLAPGTDLDYVPTTRTLTSSTGDDVALPLVSTTAAGLVPFGWLTGAEAATLPHIHGALAGPVYEHVRNVSGATMAAMTPYHVVGSQGDTDRVQIVPADSSDPQTMPASGILMTALANNEDGHGVIAGVPTGLNTVANPSGTTLYVGSGVLTATPPATNIQAIAVVGRSHASTGTLSMLHGPSLALVAYTGAYGDLIGRPTLGTAAAAATTDFAPAAQGVSNGNNHDHSGGDGAQIAYGSLAGLPTLGGAAALDVGTTAGTVAAGDAPATALAGHVGAADPHAQYLAKVPAPATLAYAATVDLDMTALAGAYRTITLTGNITFTTSNRSAGEMVTLRIICDSTQRTLTFPAGWRFIGPKPANIAASKVAVLTVMLFGTADTDGVAAYGVES